MAWLLWGEGKARVRVTRTGRVLAGDDHLGWVRRDEGGWYAVRRFGNPRQGQVIAWGPERVSRWSRRSEAVRILLSVLSDRTGTWWGEVKADG